MQQPTVYLRIAGSAIAFEERLPGQIHSEILETVDFYDDGSPDWTTAGICEANGEGGRTGMFLLNQALLAAEENARLVGCEIVHAPRQLQPSDVEKKKAERRYLRQRLIAWIASKCEVNYRAWEAGCSASPEPLDYVRWARDVLSAGWPDFPGTVPEGEQFVADVLETQMESGKLNSWQAIAEELFDTLTAE